MHEGDQILAIDGQVGVNNTTPPPSAKANSGGL